MTIAAATLVLLTAVSAAPRFALSVGSNAGAPTRDKLWFAEQDAQRFGDALIELGGFGRADVIVLKAPSGDALRAAVQALAEHGRSALAQGQVPLLVFYYSGHADPTGLELGGDRVSYAELSASLAAMTEGVRVMILDACNSGALTQVKGARPAPLDFEVIRDPRADGVAIITSSSASEQAQESAQLKGSFFTHHFMLGLRGAADADGDQRVTLTESYRYAYHRTLAATSEAGAAPQHPTYAIKLAGKGEVVLVDLRRARSALSFPAGTGKSYLVTNERSQEVVAEVTTSGDALRVALPAGRYRVERLKPVPRLTGVLELPVEGAVAVDDAALVEVLSLVSRAKGDTSARRTHLGAEAWLGSPVMTNFGPGYGLGLTFRQDVGPLTLMLSASYSQKDVDDAGFTYRYQAGTALVGAAWRFDFARLALLLGLQGGAAIAHQLLPDKRATDGLVVLGGPIAGVAVPLTDAISLRVTEAGNAQTFRLNDAQVVRLSAQLAVGVEIDL